MWAPLPLARRAVGRSNILCSERRRRAMTGEFNRAESSPASGSLEHLVDREERRLGVERISTGSRRRRRRSTPLPRRPPADRHGSGVGGGEMLVVGWRQRPRMAKTSQTLSPSTLNRRAALSARKSLPRRRRSGLDDGGMADGHGCRVGRRREIVVALCCVVREAVSATVALIVTPWRRRGQCARAPPRYSTDLRRVRDVAAVWVRARSWTCLCDGWTEAVSLEATIPNASTMRVTRSARFIV